MKTMLVTGGTVFVSRFAAEYFRNTYDVFVLNCNTGRQSDGVSLLEGDRHNLGSLLKGRHFDVVLDVTAYDERDVRDLLDGLESFDDYILISSSAVYPQWEKQPFTEATPVGPNSIWGSYGTDKIAAEAELKSRVPGAYILRPPYLYGPGNNVYREAFCFDCARENRPFYLPGDGGMPLQFFHVQDLCRFIEILLAEKPEQRTFNVGNPETVTVRSWAALCYSVLGKAPAFLSVTADVPQRSYFPFYDYAYELDVTAQLSLMPETKSLEDGLREAWQWYRGGEDQVRKKPLIAYIDDHL